MKEKRERERSMEKGRVRVSFGGKKEREGGVCKSECMDGMLTKRDEGKGEMMMMKRKGRRDKMVKKRRAGIFSWKWTQTDTRHRHQGETAGSTDQQNLSLEKKNSLQLQLPSKNKKGAPTGGLLTANLETLFRCPFLSRGRRTCHFDIYSYSPMTRTGLGMWACLPFSLSLCLVVVCASQLSPC